MPSTGFGQPGRASDRAMPSTGFPPVPALARHFLPEPTVHRRAAHLRRSAPVAPINWLEARASGAGSGILATETVQLLVLRSDTNSPSEDRLSLAARRPSDRFAA